jgi:hypothetical protein
MTWANYGKGEGQWEIDHIIPLQYNNPSLEQVIQRCHWTNLQPLWGIEEIVTLDSIMMKVLSPNVILMNY